MKNALILICLLVLSCVSFSISAVFGQQTYSISSKDTILEFNNNLFSLSDGKYVYSNNNQRFTEINEIFFKEIIGGNIFIIFDWLGFLTIEKNTEIIKVNLNKNREYVSEISKNFISIFNSFICFFNNLINNKIEIKYDKEISINYKKETNTIYIKKISGITIKNHISNSKKLFNLLDFSHYKLIYHNNNVFLGIINPDKEHFFEYYIYTSIADINKRGFSEVFNQSNKKIREEIKPLVINLF